MILQKTINYYKKNLYLNLCRKTYILGIFLFIVGISQISWSIEIPVFTNDIYTITSFSNIEKYNNSYRYSVSSFEKKIYFDFPIVVSPTQKIQIYGSTIYNTIYVNHSNQVIYLNNPIFLLNHIAHIRLQLTQQILSLYPKSGAFTLALILGNRSFLDKEFLEYVTSSGLLHLFALSGLHLVIFVSLFSYLLSLLPLTRRNICLLMFPLALFYLLLGGVGISLQRAFLFYTVSSFFFLIRIPILGDRIFFISLLINIILLSNNIFSLSFILSYAAVAGIVFLYQICYNSIKQYLGKQISSYLAVSLSAFLMVSPILIFHFNTINLYAIISSTLIVPFMPIILLFCFIEVFLSSFGIQFLVLDQLVFLWYQFMKISAQFFSTLPFSVVYFTNTISKYVGISLFIVIIIYLLYTKRVYHDKME